MDRDALRQCLREVPGFADPILEDAVWAVTVKAAEARPEVRLDMETWVAALYPALSSSDPHAALSRLHADDLWLAAALGVADPCALSIFERELRPHLDRALRRFADDDDARTELRQLVTVRLLVADPPHPPRITTYQGHGRLARWLATIAARVAVNRRRLTRRHTTLDDVPELVLEVTPELARLRSEHRTVFVESLREAFRRLDADARTLLRLRYADDIKAMAIARAYGVHESTMSRRLAAARAFVAAEFELLAAQRLGDIAGIEELLSVMRSQLDSSLTSLLATTR